jgi:hypothetical protein
MPIRLRERADPSGSVRTHAETSGAPRGAVGGRLNRTANRDGAANGSPGRHKRMDKYVVLIASAGRTATAFFAEMLPSAIPGAFGVHEPDLLELRGVSSIADISHKIRTFGWHHMVAGRLAGTSGLRNIGQKLLSGEWAQEEAAERLYRSRAGYYSSLPCEYIIEAYSHWYSVLPLLPAVFAHYKVAGIVRDPRSWMRSMIKVGTHYGARDWATRLRFGRLVPAMVGDTEYADRWREMSPFQRLCWTWKMVNSLLCDGAAKDPRIRVFRYEDLFSGASRRSHLERMLEFVTAFDDRRFDYTLDPDMLTRRVNVRGEAKLPPWQSWEPWRARQMHDICGSLMAELGYGDEPQWKAKAAGS